MNSSVVIILRLQTVELPLEQVKRGSLHAFRVRFVFISGDPKMSLSRCSIGLITIATAILCAQQTAPSVDTAAEHCRIIRRRAEWNAKLLAGNPQEAQRITDRAKPVLDACAAFQAEPSASTAESSGARRQHP